MTEQFPVAGPRQPVYDYLQRLGFTQSAHSDKFWSRGDVSAHIYGAGSMVRVGKDEMPLGDLRAYLANIN